MFFFNQSHLSFCAMCLGVSSAGTVFAQAADHTSSAGIANNTPPLITGDVSAHAYDEGTASDPEDGSYTTFANTTETIDIVNAGGYRYFGSFDAGLETTFAPDDLGESILMFNRTDISNLAANSYYMIFFSHAATTTNFATGTFNITSDNPSVSYAVTYSPNGNFNSSVVYFIEDGLTELSFFSQAIVAAAPILQATADASAAIGVVEFDTDPTTDIASHNDCDINNDGVTDAQDIDLLSFVLRTGAIDANAPANTIAIFDVDGDGDLDGDDVDELIYVCLGTDYGDLDLDGDVDDADLGTAFSNFTGPVGEQGGKGWADGDVDGDGDVDDADLAIMFSNYTGPM